MSSRLSLWIILVIACCGQAATQAAGAAPHAPACKIGRLVTHEAPSSGRRTPVFRRAGSEAVFYRSGLAIDADGAPNAYHPDDLSGIDALVHAGVPGNWWALVTENGEPILQKGGTYTGFYVSMTWLHREDGLYSPVDPRYWIDAREVPYLAIPRSVWEPAGIDKGDLAVVLNEKANRISWAIVADWGTEETLGEGSIALAETLKVPSDPRVGGVPEGIAYLVFPNTAGRPRWPRDVGEMERKVAELLAEFGGKAMLNACLTPAHRRRRP
jgi:hypothetical protein